MGDRRTPLLGRLAVHLGMLSTEQLVECLAEQERSSPRRNLGEIFVVKGHLTTAQVAQLAREQQRLLAKQRARTQQEQGGSSRAEAPPAEARSSASAEPRRTAAPEPRQAPPRLRAGARAAADPAALERILREAVEAGASDVHVHAGARLRLRLGGELEERGERELTPDRAEALVLGALSDAEQRLLEERGELDFCYALAGVGRFRANVYRQQGGLDGVFRVIPPQPPSLADLGLPERIENFVDYQQGMVLVTGPTGCGKTSTLAALVNLVNERRADHILSIEDPIEYIHPSKRCLVNQRSVTRHTGSFARALRAALREDPDVIVIGELRDLETISLALTAAETGHFVLATLHTGGAIRTINRMVGAFPANQQGQVRTMLSESLRAVVSQRLLPRADGSGRVPAIETLVINKAVGNLIRENKTFQIHSILQTGSSQGMGLLDQSIRGLVDSGDVSREEALRHCEEPRSLAA